MARNGRAREIARRTIGIIECQIPVSLLVEDQLTGNDLIVEPANLRKRVLVEDRHIPSLGKLTFAKHSQQNGGYLVVSTFYAHGSGGSIGGEILSCMRCVTNASVPAWLTFLKTHSKT